MSTSLFETYVHLIFSTHNRERSFHDESTRHSIHGYLAKLIRDKGAKYVVVGGTSDHVHIILKLPKTVAPSDLVAIIKRESSKFVKTLGKKYHNFSWQRGYGMFSVGPLRTKHVERYVRNQMQHHKQMSFQEEFLRFLDKYQIEYDEKYLWD